MLKLLGFALALYAGLAAFVWFSQERLLFMPQGARAAARAPAGWAMEPVAFTARDGVRLRGVLVKPPGAPAPLVLYFGGNAEEATGSAADAPRLWGRHAVLLVNYRGYGESEGRPGERELVADALEIFDWAVARADIDGARVALHGASLGSGVAVQVAAARPVRCVVLSTPFDSVRAVASGVYPWLPVGLLIRHPFDSAARAPAIAAPALVLLAERDDVIPPVHGERLAAAWGGPVQRVVFAGRGHNDLFADPGYGQAIVAFLDRHLGPGATGKAAR